MSSVSRIKDVIPYYNTIVLPKHWLSAAAAGVKYRFPAKKLRVIGVTGTNGKTTTCFMIWKMLNMAGRKAGLMTTVAWGVDELHEQIEHMTTVDTKTLNSRMEQIQKMGAEFLVLEVTSHAMVQFRTLGVPIEIAVMTNVTHEHLDYHKTFERYRAAKCRLFKKAKFGVVNADDASARHFIKSVLGANAGGDGGGFDDKYITYGIKSGEMRAAGVKLAADGVKYSCGDMKIETRIPGEFNVYNSLAAACVGRKIGLTEKEIHDGLYALEEVEGRMNRVNMGQDFEVIVDYAHTPDAFLKVFKSVEGHEGRILTVTGGAGRRDESTRAERGEIAGKYSDIVVITEDDSRDEDPEKIAQSFVEGAESVGKKLDQDLFVNLDRRSALEQILGMAHKGDLVLVLGKGHEKTILRADGAHEFEDLKVVREVLKNLN